MPKQAKNLKKMRPAIGSRLKKAEAGKLVYKIDCSIPLSDDLITADTMGQFATYLAEHIKIEGKTGRLGELVKVGTDDKAITIACREVLFAKRYLKFLTRKFLKREKLRDYVRPVSTKKLDYQLRYYDIQLDEDEE